MGISKTNDHIQIKIKMPNPSQEPPASSKAPNQYFKDMGVLCTFKINIGSQNFQHGSNRNSDYIQIKIKIPNPSQEPPASSKAPNEDLKEMYVLFTFQIKIEIQNLRHWCIKDLKDLKDLDVFCSFKNKMES